MTGYGLGGDFFFFPSMKGEEVLNLRERERKLLTTSTSVQVDCVARATLTQARRLVALGAFVGTVYGTVAWRALYTLRHGCKPGVTINTGPATESQ